MVIILILVVLWGVVLGPGLFRRLRAREGHQSIDSFHHSLHLLERSAPPAFRLTSDGPAEMVTAAPSPAASARPRLVLLRPVGQGGEESMYDHSDDFVDAVLYRNPHRFLSQCPKFHLGDSTAG